MMYNKTGRLVTQTSENISPGHFPVDKYSSGSKLEHSATIQNWLRMTVVFWEVEEWGEVVVVDVDPDAVGRHPPAPVDAPLGAHHQPKVRSVPKECYDLLV